MYLNSKYEQYVNDNQTEKYKKISEVIKKGNISSIIYDIIKNIFYVENGDTPLYVRKDIISWGKKQGYLYLYDLIKLF